MYQGRGGGVPSGRGDLMPPTSLSKALKFASTKNERLKTAKNIYQGREDKIRQAEDAEHLGRPPPGKYLVHGNTCYLLHWMNQRHSTIYAESTVSISRGMCQTSLKFTAILSIAFSRRFMRSTGEFGICVYLTTVLPRAFLYRGQLKQPSLTWFS
ncbi:hypothetical protein LB503_013547 [Fusarium chuoi]|nr:hypothetical protein LB503_013547 [Fusarium chuoi]